MINPEFKVYCVISHTHWDREWYMPLEQFRHRLVDLMDRLLTILRTQPDYIFHLDAQTVVLEDYLAVRPDKREELRGYISRRRLMVGPFYLQNDFYLTSGESTVRNLLEGQKLCREFGGSAKVGYAADQFGNISQLPQILREFGIDNFVFGRGFSQTETDSEGKTFPKKTPTEFIWQGADGTEVLAVHMRHWYNNAQRFSADIDKAERYLRKVAEPYGDSLTATPYLLLMNGVDHLEAQGDVRKIIDSLQARLPDNEYILQYNLDDYVDAVKSYIKDNDIELEIVKGELRCDEGLTTLQGTLSSRAYLKSLNVKAQTMLENRIEPLYAMLERYGMKGIYPHDRLVYAWKKLIRNHPHDSICGCSTDALHRHMENRYAELSEFTDEQLRRGLLCASEHTDLIRRGSERDYIITVANTLATSLCGTVELTLKMLVSDDMESFCIRDAEGREAEFCVLSKVRRDTVVYSPVNLPGKQEVYEYTLLLDAGEVAPFSLKSFLVTASEKTPEIYSFADSTIIENEFLTLSVDTEGRVDIADKRSNRIIADCLRFEDREDNGDSYAFMPMGHKPIYSDSWEKTVTPLISTPLKQSVRIDYKISLPLFYDEKANKRSEERVDSCLSAELTLYRGRPYVELSYTLDNASRDHHLSLCVDSDVETEVSYADSAFDLVRRTPDMHYYNTPVKLEHNATFAAIEKEGVGMAVLTEGSHEYMHPEDKTNRLSFALVRSTGGIVHGGNELWCTPENQCIRTLAGRLAIAPFEGGITDIPSLSLSFRTPLMATATSCDVRKFSGGRPCVQDTSLAELFYLPDPYKDVVIPDNSSAIEVEGKGIVFSAFKQSEDESAMLLRVFNSTEEEQKVTVTAKGRMFRTRMDEVPRSFIGMDKVTLKLSAKQILTLLLES